MATVRFSGDLKTTIVNCARNMYNDRIQKAKEKDPTWGDRFYSLAFGSYKDMLADVDPAWLRFGNSFSVRATVAGTDSNGVPCRVDIREELYLSSQQPIPGGVLPVEVTGCEMNTGYSLTFTMKDSRYDQLIQEMSTRMKNLQAIEKQRDVFVQGIAELLNAHSTLAPALRAFPPLWDLLSEQVKEKHKEIRVVEKKEEPVIKADLAALNAAMAIHKMTK